MNRLAAVCALALVGGLLLGGRSQVRALDDRDMQGVSGGCIVGTSYTCSGTTLRCSCGGCYTGSGGSAFCNWSGLSYFSASGTYQGTVDSPDDPGRTTSSAGADTTCGFTQLCLSSCGYNGPSLVCYIGPQTPVTQGQVQPDGPACSTGS